MKNMQAVVKKLTVVMTELKCNKINVKVASEMVNCAGKIISAQKVQLEYAALRKEKPEIEFLTA